MRDPPSLCFNHGEDVDALRATVAQFARKEIAPRASLIGGSDQFPMDFWRKMGAPGVLGITAEAHYV